MSAALIVGFKMIGVVMVTGILMGGSLVLFDKTTLPEIKDFLTRKKKGW